MIKKVVALKFNPSIKNFLVSASGENNFKFWDITSGKEFLNIEDAGCNPHAMCFNLDGSLLAVTDKNKSMHILDPRASEKHITQSTVNHDSLKGSRVIWMTKTNRIFTVGSNKVSERQFKLWDPRDISKPLAEESIDTAAGILMPFWDEDTSIMYLAGKGDGNIRFYEFVDEEPYYFAVDAFKSNVPQKGMGMIPKYACDTSVHEVTRLLKLCSDTVVPLSFCVPRKSTLFQKDIYPDTLSPNATVSIEEWLQGKNGTVEHMAMNPKDKVDSKEEETQFTQEKKTKN